MTMYKNCCRRVHIVFRISEGLLGIEMCILCY